MADLSAFLRARLDEQITEAARWRDLADRVGAAHGSPDPPEDDMLIGDHAYFALHKAADVLLADIAVKRRILDEREDWACVHNSGMWMLKILALPFAGHPDYDPTWRV